MTRNHTAKRLRLTAAALLASLLISPATAPAATSAGPPPAVAASGDLHPSEPGGFEIDGEPDEVDPGGSQT